MVCTCASKYIATFYCNLIIRYYILLIFRVYQVERMKKLVAHVI